MPIIVLEQWKLIDRPVAYRAAIVQTCDEQVQSSMKICIDTCKELLLIKLIELIEFLTLYPCITLFIKTLARDLLSKSDTGGK